MSHIGHLTNDCPICRVIDRPGYEAVRDRLRGPLALPTVPRPVCRHLGEERRREGCKTCKGHVEVKVMACALHREATVGKPLPGIPCCADCADWRPLPPPPGPVQVTMGDVTGIGDHVLMLATTEGLRRQGHHVSFVTCGVKPEVRQWVELFGGYDRLLSWPVSGIPLLDPRGACPDAWSIPGQRKLPAWEWAARACGTTAALPEAKPLPADALEWAEQYRGYVALSPWSAVALRTWPKERWQQLESLLLSEGVRTVLVDAPGHAGRNRDFGSERVIDETPARKAAVLSVARAVVSNDSGMAHVAAMLRRPTVVLSWANLGDRIFSIYPTAKVIQTPHMRDITPAAVVQSLRANLS